MQMIEFKLPDVGEGMHEGEISRWLVKEGDTVTMDQPVVEVQTDKVNAELSSPATGVIKKLFFAEGDTVHVGETLFILDTGSDEVAATAAPTLEEKPQTGGEVPAAEARPLSAVINRALATPYVRQLAREMNIDIEQVTGTGPAGRVTEADLQQFAQRPVSSPASALVQEKQEVPQVPAASVTQPNTAKLVLSGYPEETEERIIMKGIRKKIAEHMSKSVSIIPHVTHFDELEMDALKALRDRLKGYAAEQGVKLTFLPFFIKALVIALKEFRTFNASIDDKTGEIILKNYYHIGIATDTEQGLIVPVIKHADRKSIFQLAQEISILAALAREGKLTLDQITGGTFTISNVGPIGGQQATPIINHPEVAILALHKMEPRVVVRNREMVIRDMMNMSLSFDHRLIDGVASVRFTNRIKQLLENPDLLLMEMV
jgi:2-oxoisovalerate dehydrogenase E2 component (dihydrolipoyl transacylase)